MTDEPRPAGDVPRIGRLLDLLGGALFLIGAGIWLWAWTGLRQVGDVPPQPDPDQLSFAALDRFVQLQELSRTGLWLMGAGVVVAVTAAVVARKLPTGRNGSTEAGTT